MSEWIANRKMIHVPHQGPSKLTRNIEKDSKLRSKLGSMFEFLRNLTNQPAGAVGLLMVGGLILAALFAPHISPYDPIAQDIPNRLAGPSLDHFLGTDYLGRDFLSRIIFGARVALLVSLPAVFIALTAGLILGLLAGYRGGMIDLIVVTITDTLQAFPGLILALALLSVFDPSNTNLIVVIAFAFTPGYMRISRALTLNIKNRSFIVAEQALGSSPLYIIRKHIFPNVLPPVLILIAMNLSQAIIIEAGLSFLGLGVRPPNPSWGAMLHDGFEYMRLSPWGVIWSGLALMVATFGFTIVGESIRDVVDPRLVSSQRIREL